MRDDARTEPRRWWLCFFYLYKIGFDRSCASEDRYQHAHFAFFGLDLFDRAVEILKRPIHYFYRFPHLEQNLGLGPQCPFFHLLRDFPDLMLRYFRRIGSVPYEASDLRRILDDVPGFVVEQHVDEDISGEELAARDLALAALAEFLHPLHRHQHGADLLLHVHRPHPFLERGLGLPLVARVGVDDVPFPVGFRLWRYFDRG